MIVLHDFFGAVREVLFDLVICKFEYLKTISECSLCCPCLGEVVHDSLVSVCLLDVIVIEIHYGVAIWKYFTFDTVVEDYFLLSVLVDSLNLTIVSNYLFDDTGISRCLIVVMRREFHVEIFSLIFILTQHSPRLLRNCRVDLDSADILLISVVFFLSH